MNDSLYKKEVNFLRKYTIPIICTMAFVAIIISSVIGVTDYLHNASAQQANTSFRQHDVCGTASPGFVRCMAIKVDTPNKVSGGLYANFAGSPNGLAPVDLQAAYKLPSSTAGKGQTVAIVDAYDYPNAESDLGVYRKQYGLSACTAANGCFRKVNQNGGTNYPQASSGWSTEMALDMDMVSAACPNCHILLVEADDSSTTNMGLAVDEAVKLGAKIVSNSYGGGSSTGYDTHFRHPGIIFTASSGDSGYGAQAPAVYNSVVAVGGTSLQKDNSTRGWNETAWSGTGSGCSVREPKPSWQKDTGCAKRAENDVSAVADPRTGVAVYVGGWGVYGGTSASAPLIAGVYALANGTQNSNAASSLYAHPKNLYDITSGSNASSCSASYLCNAGPGYDGPTGLGTPNGIAAFSSSGVSTPPGPTPTPGEPTPTPAPPGLTPTPTAAPQPGSFGSTTGMTTEEKQLSLSLFAQINKDRAAVGRPAYKLDENITRAAYKHTLKQLDAETISHQLPGEPYVCVRLQNEGATFTTCSENVGMAGGSSGSDWDHVMVVHNAMMAEPANVGHHAAIISPVYHWIGISVLVDKSQNAIYLTEDFMD